ncbi:permease [Streptomyces sp. NPDC088923]|uniref:permease n=1 Tax=Streptomyces sp. NPDC088923 TaxID=3365913 RepID=UPI003824FFE7
MIGTVLSVLGPMFVLDLRTPPVAAWCTVFTAVVVQGVPFLLLRTLVSAAIGAFVWERALSRVLPRTPSLAVPVVRGASCFRGVRVPRCRWRPVSCGVGAPPAAAFAFLLSAPAINPVVLVATSLAFPGRPLVVVARFVGSLATAS